MDGIVYDLCIVGAGLIGSAAARHATIISPNAKICLIGPNEPKERSIFASHYDEGRITRILDTDPTWSVLSRRSVSRYRDIEQKTGKFYLKIGHSSQKGNDLHTENDVKDWFKKTEGCKSMFQQLMKAMFDIVKGVQPVSTHSNTCVTTLTPTLNIYCDMVTPTLGLAVGGCGHGAKASDEIGKMAARMVIAGKWDHDLPADRFRVRFKNEFNSKL
ncbi:uncharacterized protein LOC144359609 [Saccoglossus kowalevskii]